MSRWKRAGDLEEQPILLGEFELLEWIGSGAMGEVWRGRHRSQKVDVAVKVIVTEMADLPRFQNAFSHEARAAAQMEHPFILSLYDYGMVNSSAEEASNGEVRAGSPYLVMEYGRLGTLAEKIGQGLSWEATRLIAFALLDGLAHCHARGLIHRDLKPQNVVLTPGIGPWPGIGLTDFGLAYALDSVRAGKGWGLSAGTPSYMAPEQVKGVYEAYGPWTDLYGMGCLLYELLTGSPPFQGSPIEVAEAQLEKVPEPLNGAGGIDAGGERWIARLLEKKRTHRFRSAAEAAWTLAQWSGPLQSKEIGQAWKALTGENSEEETLQGTYVLKGVLPHSSSGDDETNKVWKQAPWRPRLLRMIGTGQGLMGLREGRIVGREEERAQLWEALQTCRRQEEVTAFLLSGGAGLGKDRLARWLGTRAQELGQARVLRVFCEDSPRFGDGVERAMERVLRLERSSRQEVQDRLYGLLEGVEQKERTYLSEAVTELIRPFKPGDMGRRILFATPEHRRIALVRFLSIWSHDEPLVIWLRDVQWGLETLEFVGAAMSGARGPLFIILTARDDLLVDLEFHKGILDELITGGDVDVLELTPMEDEEIKELLDRRLFLESSTAYQIVQASAGNPQFALEVLGQWLEDGLESTPQGFVRPSDKHGAIPGGLVHVWERALERVVAGRKDWAQALEMAAVLGERIRKESWSAALETFSLSIDEELIEMMLKRRYFRGAGSALQFGQRLFREALLARLRSRGDLQEFSRRGAAALELQEDVDEIRELIGFLWLQGDEALRGAEHLYKAALRRQEQGAFHGVAYLMDRAWEALCPDPDSGQASANQSAGVLLAKIANLRTRALRVLGENEEAFRWAHRALEEGLAVQDDVLIGESRMYLAQLYYLHGESEKGRREGEETLRLLENRRGAESLCAYTCVVLGSIGKRSGDHEEAIQWTERGKAFARAAPDFVLEATLEHLRVSVALVMDDGPTIGPQEIENLILASHTSGSRLALARALNVKAEEARKKGEMKLAQQVYREAIEVFRTVEPSRGMTPELNLGLVLLERKDYEQARRIAENVLFQLRRRKVLLFVLFANWIALPGLLAAEDISEVLTRLKEILPLTKRLSMEEDKDIQLCLRSFLQVLRSNEEFLPLDAIREEWTRAGLVFPYVPLAEEPHE